MSNFSVMPADPQDQTFLLELEAEAKNLSNDRDEALEKIRSELQEIQDPMDDIRQMV